MESADRHTDIIKQPTAKVLNSWRLGASCVPAGVTVTALKQCGKGQNSNADNDETDQWTCLLVERGEGLTEAFRFIACLDGLRCRGGYLISIPQRAICHFRVLRHLDSQGNSLLGGRIRRARIMTVMQLTDVRCDGAPTCCRFQCTAICRPTRRAAPSPRCSPAGKWQCSSLAPVNRRRAAGAVRAALEDPDTSAAPELGDSSGAVAAELGPRDDDVCLMFAGYVLLRSTT